MVLRTYINIAPNTLQDLTIDNLDKEGTVFENYYPKVFSRVDLESMIFDDIIETDVSAVSGDERFTFSSTGFNIIQKTYNELSDLAIADTPLIMIPSNDVSVLSDGTNSYAIKDAQARSDIDDLQINKVPTSRKVNNKALSSDITLTASDVGALPDSTVIPTVNNATLTIQKNGTNVQTFTANASSNVTANISVPTDTNDLTNGAGFLTSSDISNMVTTDTAQNITETKTFVGQKRVAFKQSGSSDKLGFTLYNNSNVEKGYLEYNPTNTVDSVPLMTLGNYASAAAGITHVGFRKYDGVSSSAYNLLTPLAADAKTPFSLTTTYTHFYLPLGYTDGNTTVTTAKTGLVDISSFGYIKGISSSDVTTALGYTPADDSGVVKTTGDQNIGGAKTFYSDITISNTSPEIYFKDTNLTKGTAPSGNNNNGLIFQDSADANYGEVYYRINSSNNNALRCTGFKMASGSSAYYIFSANYNANGEYFLQFTAASQDAGDANISLTKNTTSTTDTTIPCMGWVNNKLNNFLTSISGYDATRTQTLKNVNGSIKWVND